MPVRLYVQLTSTLDGIEIILRWKKESKTGLYQGNIQCGTIFAILIIISRYLITLKNIKYN